MATKDKLPSNADIWGTPHVTPVPMRAGELTVITAGRNVGKSTIARGNPTRKAAKLAAKNPAMRKKQRRSK